MEKYTKEKLEEAVKNSKSYAGVLRYLGVKQAGGTQCHIKTKIKKFNIDTIHFTGRSHLKGKTSNNKRTYTEILVLKPKGSNKEKTQALKRAMIESKITYFCHKCYINKWNQQMIALQIHHIDGNPLNNQRENVIFLCPNCHSQTEGYNKRK